MHQRQRSRYASGRHRSPQRMQGVPAAGLGAAAPGAAASGGSRWAPEARDGRGVRDARDRGRDRDREREREVSSYSGVTEALSDDAGDAEAGTLTGPDDELAYIPARSAALMAQPPRSAAGQPGVYVPSHGGGGGGRGRPYF
jgi:hypothetical protein